MQNATAQDPLAKVIRTKDTGKIRMRNEDRERAIAEVVGRVVDETIVLAQKPGGMPLLEVVNDTMFHERKRLKGFRGPLKQEDSAFWNDVQRALPKAAEREIKELLNSITSRFAREVAGNFNPYVYNLSVKLLPVGMGLLLNALSPQRLFKQFPAIPSIEQNVHLSGEIEMIQSLEKKGTVILVPTHLSHLDSPVIGWSIFKLGLPPFTYGAGLNLFNNPLLSFFMRNLGAYRVDRRKTAPLYKEVLKEYATCSLELGYNNLFFPGGTRSRSGQIERKIKKGLLGTGLRAYIHNLQAKKDRPKIFFVPCTINYHLVLEAETLIEDFLKEAGRSRYIIEDDEASDLRRILHFVRDLTTLDAQIQVVFGQAIDPFGNLVDKQGISYDRRGRPIEIHRYVLRDGQPVIDDQRDHEYTREVAEQVTDQFSRKNMIMATHLVAHAAFGLLKRKNPDMDLYRLLHTGGRIDQIPRSEAIAEIDLLLTRLRHLALHDQIRLEPLLHTQTPADVLDQSLRFFGSYHTSAVLFQQGDRLRSQALELLFYYQNRLDGYPLKPQKTPEIQTTSSTPHPA